MPIGAKKLGTKILVVVVVVGCFCLQNLQK